MKMTREFWWAEEGKKKHIHWSSWDKLIQKKSKGGMGFRDLALFNQALLAKQAWRLLDKPDSLCARLLKARYFPNANLMDTAFVKNPSPGWKGITHGLELLKKGAVGLGHGRVVD
jgi:hypothetical protein